MQIFHDRQALHQIPELDRTLPKTLAYLQEQLGSRAFHPVPDALCAFFDFGAPGTLAFRSDMDALPIGHACGHDGHMAILLELARRLTRRKTLAHNVLLVFQPAEETTGGASELCDCGVFAAFGVEAIFGLHIWPGLPAGRLFTRAGPMMAAACQIDGRITGRTGHIAAPGPDALAAAAAFVRRTRREGRGELVKYGLLQAGQAGNVTAGQAVLRGSARCLSDCRLARRRQQLQQAARVVEKETGCCFDLRLSPGYPAVQNPAGLVDRVRRAAPCAALPAPSLLSEDFSCYQHQMPGVFFFLGAGNGPALHTAGFDFPEEILLRGADFWEALAVNFR